MPKITYHTFQYPQHNVIPETRYLYIEEMLLRLLEVAI